MFVFGVVVFCCCVFCLGFFVVAGCCCVVFVFSLVFYCLFLFCFVLFFVEKVNDTKWKYGTMKDLGGFGLRGRFPNYINNR